MMKKIMCACVAMAMLLGVAQVNAGVIKYYDQDGILIPSDSPLLEGRPTWQADDYYTFVIDSDETNWGGMDSFGQALIAKQIWITVADGGDGNVKFRIESSGTGRIQQNPIDWVLAGDDISDMLTPTSKHFPNPNNWLPQEWFADYIGNTDWDSLADYIENWGLTMSMHLGGLPDDLNSLNPAAFKWDGNAEEYTESVVVDKGTTTPEPATMLILSLGMAGAGFAARRRLRG